MRWDLVFVGVNFTGSRTIHLCLKVFVLVVFIASVSLVILTKCRGEREGYKTNNTFFFSSFACILLFKYEQITLAITFSLPKNMHN